MLWQLAWGVLVLAVVVAAVFAGTASPPPVIGHHGVLGLGGGEVMINAPCSSHSTHLLHRIETYFYRAVIVEPGQELGGVPVAVWRLPVSIGPDKLRSIPVRHRNRAFNEGTASRLHC